MESFPVLFKKQEIIMRYSKNRLLFADEFELSIISNKEEIEEVITIIKEKFKAEKIKGWMD